MARFRKSFTAHGARLKTSNFGHSQLYNPVDSARNLFVTQVLMATDTVGVLQMNRAPGIILPEIVDSISSMDFGSPTATKAEIRTDDRVTLVDGEFFATMGPFHAPIHWIYTEPLCLPPGNGLIITHTMRGAELYANYEWQETDASYYATSR